MRVLGKNDRCQAYTLDGFLRYSSRMSNPSAADELTSYTESAKACQNTYILPIR